MLLKLVIIVITGCVVIQVISQDCPALGVCVNNLELRYNATVEKPTLEKSLNFCLSVIKDGDVCISRTGCDLTGLEPLYIAYRKLGYTINRYCSENVCPDLTSIEECWKQLDYSGIPKGEYSQFCWSVQKCQKRPLTGNACHSANQIFESQLSADPKKIIQYICNSDCLNLNETVDAVRFCRKTVSSQENSCEIYNVLVECLESFPVCPEVNTVLEYFYEGYSKLQEKCQTESPTTGSYPDMTTTENIVTSSPHKKITGEINVTITSTVPTSSHISTYIESSSVKERITKTRLVTSKSTELVTSTPSTKEYSSVSRQTSTFKPTTEKKIISTMLASVTNTTVNPTSIPTTKLITTKRADDKISSDGRRGTTLHIPSFSKGMKTKDVKMTTRNNLSTSKSATIVYSSSVSTALTTSTFRTSTLGRQKSTGKTGKVKTGGQTLNKNGAVSTWHHKFLASFIFVILWFVL